MIILPWWWIGRHYLGVEKTEVVFSRKKRAVLDALEISEIPWGNCGGRVARPFIIWHSFASTNTSWSFERERSLHVYSDNAPLRDWNIRH